MTEADEWQIQYYLSSIRSTVEDIRKAPVDVSVPRGELERLMSSLESAHSATRKIRKVYLSKPSQVEDK